MALVGCGGGSSSTETTGSATTTGGASTSGVLRIGTVNYIDSLNPFNYVEAQSTNAMIMIYPQLVQYGVGMKFEGDWAEFVGDLGRRQGLDVPSAGRTRSGRTASRLTASDAAWTINTTVKYAAGPTAVAAAALAHVKSAEATDRHHARDPLRVAGGERARAARDVLRPAGARLGPEGRRRRQGSEDVSTRSSIYPSSAAAPTRSPSTRRRERRRSSPTPTSRARRRTRRESR